MAHDTFKAGDLTAVIGDNGAHDAHRAGYNGVHHLSHRTEPENLFVPFYAGLNLEHYFDGETEFRDAGPGGSRDVFFEPRRAPMEFRKLSDTEAELHQPPTPTFHVESWTRFSLAAPHYLDFSFRCRPYQHVFRHGYVGVFWASYINAPEDRSLYFRGPRVWQQLCSPEHNAQSTLVHREDAVDLKFTPGLPDALFKNLAPVRYAEPFFYGLFRRHVFILMFDRTEGIRFTHSPNGGGGNAKLEATNPAWDFQFVIPAYEVGRDYSFRARAVYRERCSREEILAEVRSWREGPGK